MLLLAFKGSSDRLRELQKLRENRVARWDIGYSTAFAVAPVPTNVAHRNRFLAAAGSLAPAVAATSGLRVEWYGL